MLRLLGFFWGVGGVMALLLSAIFRLVPRVIELQHYTLGGLQWVLLIGFVLYMLYAEGYKGFHLNFAPRVALRADYISEHGKVWMCVLAPLVCMGYLHATRKRQIVSTILTLGIILLIVGVSHLNQPWRGLIDAGVVAGLGAGVLSLLFFVVRVLQGKGPTHISADLPDLP